MKNMEQKDRPPFPFRLKISGDIFAFNMRLLHTLGAL